MTEVDMDCELEARVEVLEVRMQRMMCRVEGSYLLLFHLRQRVEKLETLCKEVEERRSFVSGLEVQQKVSLRTTTKLTEVSHGSVERQTESVDVAAKRKRLGINEEVTIEIERQAKQLAKNLEEKLVAAELSVHSLQQTERELRLPEDLIQDDEESDHPSRTLRFSDESEHHMIEDSGQVKAGKKVDELREAKDVGVEQQTDECGTKSIVLIQEVEQRKDTEETDLLKAEEYNHKKNGLDKKLEVKGVVEFEDERKSEDIQRKSNEFEIQFVDIAGHDPKDLIGLDKKTEKGTPIKMVHGMDGRSHDRARFIGTEELKRDLSEESRNVSMEEEQHCYPLETTESEEPLEALESVISKELARQAFEVGRIQEEEEEEIKHDYEIEMGEVEGCLEESELNTSEELERRLSEEAEKREELIQSNVSSSLKLMIDNIENKLHVRMPNDLRKSVDECFRKLIEFSLTTLKRNIRSLESELQTSNDLRRWLQGQMRRLYTELHKKAMKEHSFRERICELQENLNRTLITLQASDNYGRQLLGKYDEVTLNIELEMQKHRNMCGEYRNLRSEYAKLKAKCESTAKSEGGCEVADQANKGTVTEREDDRCAATDVEKQMSVLAQSQRELKRKIRSYHKVPRVLGSLNAETVEGSESLNMHRKELMDILERQPHLHCELIEEALTAAKKDHDYFWKGIIKELKLTLLGVAGTDSPLLTNLLLEYGFSQDWIDTEGNTALHCAARRGNVHVGRALIVAGAHVNTQNRRKMTPLHMSLYFGHVNFSLMLLRNQANLNLTDLNHNTPLHLATMSGNFVMVNQLIESKADVNAVDADGDTPLFNAAVVGDEGIAEMLVEAGSDITAINSMGSTPLHVAAWQGRTAFCSYLLKQGVSVDPINFHDVTPLHLAAMEDHVYVVHLLINRGSRVNCLEDRTDSPLHYAAKFCSISMMRGLIRAGANVLAINFRRRTPLHIAAAEGHTEACSVLLDAGSDVNALDERDRTPLHMVAMYGGRISVAELLIKKGANMTAVDSNGLTPCDLGYVFKHSLFSRWLKKRILVNQPQRGKGARRKKRNRVVK